MSSTSVLRMKSGMVAYGSPAAYLGITTNASDTPVNACGEALIAYEPAAIAYGDASLRYIVAYRLSTPGDTCFGVIKPAGTGARCRDTYIYQVMTYGLASCAKEWGRSLTQYAHGADTDIHYGKKARSLLICSPYPVQALLSARHTV